MMEYEKDYSLLRPFDLDAAKRGESICCATGADATYICGPNSLNSIVVQWHDDRFSVMHISNIRMKPLFFVEGKPVYKGDVLFNTTGAIVRRVVSMRIGCGEVLCEDGIGYDINELTWSAQPKVKREGWINVYGYHRPAYIHRTRKDADFSATRACGNADNRRIACVRIEWQE